MNTDFRYTDGATILITGGAGFVGGHLVEHLHSLGFTLIVIDDLSAGSRSNLPQDAAQIQFIQGDVCDPDLIHDCVRQSDLVVHMAAVVGMKAVCKQPLKAIQTNVSAVQALAESCSEFSVPLIYVSSSAVYRPIGVQHNNGCSESDLVHHFGCHPASIYAEAKLLGESICDACGRMLGLKYLIVRPFNLIGTRQSSEYGMVVPTFIRCALEGTPLPIFGDGTQERVFSDVRQAVRLMWALATKTGFHGQAVNLATNDRTVSILELAETVREVLGKPVPYVFIPYEAAYESGYIDIRTRRPSLRRLESIVGQWKATRLVDTVAAIFEYERSRLGSATPSREEPISRPDRPCIAY